MNDFVFNSHVIKSIKPVDERSRKIYEKKECALLGISPFNGYFNFINIFTLIEWAFHNFRSFKIFLPNEISYYTLKAINYNGNIEKKVSKHDKHLKNKVIRALELITKKYSCSFSEDIFVEMSDLKVNVKFIEIFNKCIKLFNENNFFKEGCLNISSEVLAYHQQIMDGSDQTNLNLAVKYILYEMPIYLNTPEILNLPSCLYVYHNIPTFIEKLYKETELIAYNQGYLTTIINFN